MGDWTIVIEGSGDVGGNSSKDLKNLLDKFLLSLKVADHDVEHSSITYSNRELL